MNLPKFIWGFFSSRTKAMLLQEYMDHRFGPMYGKRWLTVVPHTRLDVIVTTDNDITPAKLIPGDMFTLNVHGSREVKLRVREGGERVRAA